MHLHEFQTKQILKEYGVPTPPFVLISSPDQIGEMLAFLEFEEGVVKAQVHAGGRGKAGGVRFGKNRNELKEHTESLLGTVLVTKQTGAAGIPVEQVIVTPAVSIAHEYYLGIIIDRKSAEAVLIASPEGGMEIEEVARKHPEKVLKKGFPSKGD